MTETVPLPSSLAPLKIRSPAAILGTDAEVVVVRGHKDVRVLQRRVGPAEQADDVADLVVARSFGSPT